MKPIKGYENYLISECGTKILNTKTNRYLSIINRSKDVNSYKAISLTKDKIKKMLSVHRLVAQTFIPNPENKPQVNHIDSNPSNNNVNNLEWCTCSENMIHSIKYGKKSITLKKNEEIKKHKRENRYKKMMKKVINIETKEIFNSLTEASISIGMPKRYLCRQLKGHIKNKTNMQYYTL
jgi:hypothetical protein